ncbi:ATP-binding cassette domain-containing protein [Agrobacterium vitis]|uniref:ABC transporter ATP-binding protein n=1 Tax=Agrobacterium vitis TaxID=373 RepID=A0A368NYJ9_AGRVI|nr:ATP-binding cassette domain-containing protein [Agrobacterium vitis]KAA3504781.1 ABC transporter ATP-binding protein [Agrobacterium vitis]KAA3518282.1 ABC transporter ATP-binding protein [Agrobacterium vitis]MCF1480479.1 ABC transporter ATP-binding protein [Agrobacterium vitis]MUZ76142.1 ATP-binding cassette domain-containing protein [Agrobacterium vitis]MUZ99695.1 ATP-binding cassette domain-containing protein [Agrobacterium vitis]
MIKLSNVFKFYRIKGGMKIILDHVSLDLRPGISYGILGINGAGKSTTMRLLAGTELPNSGTIRRTSRISWPLGFGAGLHPEMTGKENIRFVAQIYGQEPRRAVEFVEDFAEIGAYINEPYKNYSSGMAQRLAFGLSMAIDFECYLIDEVTAVGDARFQARCHEEFAKRRARSDIIMISHSMDTVRDYCSRAIVLAHGVMHEFTNVDDAIEIYKKLNQ